jgi:hypothetical protein
MRSIVKWGASRCCIQRINPTITGDDVLVARRALRHAPPISTPEFAANPADPDANLEATDRRHLLKLS